MTSVSIPRLEMRGIRKAFMGVPAIRDGSIVLLPGEVHAVMGANGAGKSTMMNVLGGVFARDGGDVTIDGSPVEIASARDAAANGIAFVHQELTMFPSMTVAENIFVDAFPSGTLGIDRRIMREQAARLLARVGCRASPDAVVENLGTGDRQMVEIARALKSAPRILIFDEATSSLSGPERDRLFEVIGKLRSEGTGILYVTHFLDEVFRICDAVTVMRNGETVFRSSARETTAAEILHHMLGEVGGTERIREATVVPHEPVLQVRGLSRGAALHDCSFDLRPGEVVGLWGLLGSGRTELLRSMTGLDPLDAGSMLLRSDGTARTVSPDELRTRIGLVTEDRRGEGLLLPFSIAENISIPQLPRLRDRFGLVDRGRERRIAEEAVKRLRIKSNSPDQIVSTLSGGNQQKVVFARWLETRPRIFLLDEPTRGLDTGAKTEILRLIVELAEGGAAILVISSELEEIRRVSDRYLVINRGRITAELPGTASNDDLMQAISSPADRIGEAA